MKNYDSAIIYQPVDERAAPVIDVDNLIVDETFLNTVQSALVAKSSPNVILSLSIENPSSGYVDTLTGLSVLLVANSPTEILFYIDDAGLIIPVALLDLNGDNLEFIQYRAVIHGDPNNPDDLNTLTDNIINLVGTENGFSSQVDLGGKIGIKDDGPNAKIDADQIKCKCTRRRHESRNW
jgi:hypothetical protein